MIAPNPNLPCRTAELYYYDFLFGESPEPIPEPIIEHIEQCQYCQEQINQLKKALLRTEGIKSQQNQENPAAVTEMLKIHFAYIGKKVTCKMVRPFLPGMLDPALEIRIPTPITAHLDNCRQCSEDLELIRKLSLERKQLCRLSQLFADKAGQDNVSCSQARAAIFTVVLMYSRQADKDILKHLCICPDCRRALYEYRDDFRNELLSDNRVQPDFPCENVSLADIFDYVVPYGFDPANDQYAKFRESLISHVRVCPTCLNKMQELHWIIFNIIERSESGVVTVYNIDESAKTQAASESDELYSGFPTKVSVVNRDDEVKDEQAGSTPDFGDALKQRVSERKLKPLIKTAIAAAAIILIGFALLLNIPTAKAITIEGIYKAIEKVQNVHISSFVPDEKEPIQEMWISRTLNTYMSKTGNELVLWDIPNRTRKTKHLDTSVTDTTQLSEDKINVIRTEMSGSLGLMPFYDISEIPANAEWSRAGRTGLEVEEGTEVYDLSWSDKAYDGSIVFWKWRFFVAAEINLPKRIEQYKWLAESVESTVETIMVVEYLSDSELQKMIKEFFP